MGELFMLRRCDRKYVAELQFGGSVKTRDALEKVECHGCEFASLRGYNTIHFTFGS